MANVTSPPATRLGPVRWLDVRLIAGILFVVLSGVLGAKVLTDAGHTEPVWVVTRSLPAGAALKVDDIQARSVHIEGGAARYLAADRPPTGFVLGRPVGAGELLPRSALASPGKPVPRRLVTVPVERFHFPAGLRAGEVVDIYSTMSARDSPDERSSHPAGAPQRVVAAVVVDGVDAATGRLGSTGSHVGVSLSVPPDEVPAVVAAAHEGSIDLVRVPQSSQGAS